jgi:DNA-binding transcriptional MerR regulator
MIKMSKRKFRIGVLSKRLQLERFIIRFWEHEFGLKTSRSSGKQRYYTEEDLKTFLLIKDLLYNKGFTIAGAKKELATPKGEQTLFVGTSDKGNNGNAPDFDRLKAENELLWQQITALQTHLKKLQQLL